MAIHIHLGKKRSAVKDSDIASLSFSQILNALRNGEGLTDVSDIKSSRFVREYSTRNGGGAIYEITYYDLNEGKTTKANVYVTKNAGQFVAAF